MPETNHRPSFAVLVVSALLMAATPPRAAGPTTAIDLASVSTDAGGLRRVHGSVGDGSTGVPVAGGRDCDGDGFTDHVMASMRAGPKGRTDAGIVYLVFGDGTVSGALDTGTPHPDILEIHGAGPAETAGSEVWVDDVTGDGLGDVLIARQSHTPDPGRIGAGALTILVGGAALRTHAATLTAIDLAAPPKTLTMTTFVGAAALDRLGIWIRTGDVTGDGVADIVMGADQTESLGEMHAGAAWVIRGGSHLAMTQTIDLANFGATALAGHVAHVTPPVGSTDHHFGATCAIGDLDGNGRGEVLVAATLNRAGASLLADGAPAGSAHASGGSTDGTVYIAWDDNFTGDPWPPGFMFDVTAPPGTSSTLNGGARNVSFGEEIMAGRDFDANGTADLFIGDLAGDGTLGQTAPLSGLGYVFYDAAGMKGLVVDLDAPPPGLLTTTFLGPEGGAIAADTAMDGDFDDDGVDDLAFSSPHASALGRPDAGIIHVFFGQSGRWPTVIDLATGALPPATEIRITEVYGAHGTNGSDTGDVLSYSGQGGDVDGDGWDDLITNEMLGNGTTPAAEDVGNLIVVSGWLLAGTPPTSTSTTTIAVTSTTSTTTTSTTSTTIVGLVPGGPVKRTRSDCYLELAVQGIHADGEQVTRNRTVRCTDGAACDVDGQANDVCTMRIALCVNQTDPNLPDCTPPDALDVVRIRGTADVFPPPLASSACGAFVEVPIDATFNKKGAYKAKKSTRKIRGVAKAPKGTRPRKDTDKWSLQCLPSAQRISSMAASLASNADQSSSSAMHDHSDSISSISRVQGHSRAK